MKKVLVLTLALVLAFLWMPVSMAQEVNEITVLVSGNSVSSDTVYYVLDKSAEKAEGFVLESVDMTVSASGEVAVSIGPITENDATDGSATFAYSTQVHVSAWTNVQFNLAQIFNLYVNSDEEVSFKSNLTLDDDAGLDTDDLITFTGAAATAYPAAGDIVLYVDITSGEADFTARLKFRKLAY